MSIEDKGVRDRSVLHFPEEVNKRFLFLLESGFRQVYEDNTLVRFESSNVAINVYHGRRSFEINLEIELLESEEGPYSFSEILRLVDQARGDAYRNYATHTKEGVTDGVRSLSQAFQECLRHGILDDSNLFTHLKLQRDELSASYALETQLQQARKKADEAWRSGECHKVVELLSPLQEWLEPSEVKKLEYARKKTS